MSLPVPLLVEVRLFVLDTSWYHLFDCPMSATRQLPNRREMVGNEPIWPRPLSAGHLGLRVPSTSKVLEEDLLPWTYKLKPHWEDKGKWIFSAVLPAMIGFEIWIRMNVAPFHSVHTFHEKTGCDSLDNKTSWNILEHAFFSSSAWTLKWIWSEAFRIFGTSNGVPPAFACSFLFFQRDMHPSKASCQSSGHSMSNPIPCFRHLL